jgi:predicted DCC family thiol-disulfide oxidoreductase YuxK
VTRGDAQLPKMTIFYDGSCPLCQAEIDYYAGIDAQQSLDLVDVTGPGFSQQDVLDKEDAMARFHVMSFDGQLLSGAQAFLEVWRVLPGWRWLAKIGSSPSVSWFLELCYRAFLVTRPLAVKLFVMVRHQRNYLN